ncbi:MAG: IclR family transcriptional regulator [Thermomicrobiales bacterium]
MAANVDLTGGALERLVAILDAFAGIHREDAGGGEPTPLGVSELSRHLGLSKGTVSRYLRRLEEAGVLQRLPDRRYLLGSRVYAWGQAAAPGSDVKRWAHPVMEHLAHEFGETVSLFVLLADQGEAVCIDQVDGLFPIRLSAAVGRHLPLHAGASPRLLLAFAPDDLREAFLARGQYPALAPATITGAATLRRVLEETRRIGHVESQDESDEGAVGVAAPIRDAAGSVRAAISVAGPATRIEGARREAIVAGVREGAMTVSRALGFRPAHETSVVSRETLVLAD